ncbi:hypothetical protein AQUCO_00900837v1 [Aquilegia coerulea]|uniref:Pentacotripeptide-repeat region of PRORP domain-containing protein n=1 Tax=Aquilegia coerulea TaxID=218851 RepID=A0A2G5EFL1_AQUCA|nr:hypothetical protein AQUCO_00900837v1 [Aquilegia coerulea]
MAFRIILKSRIPIFSSRVYQNLLIPLKDLSFFINFQNPIHQITSNESIFEKLNKFIKTHVLRLLKMDLIAVLTELERQEEVYLGLKAMKIWEAMRNEGLYPDCQTYSEVIRGFLRYGSPADAMNIYEDMKKSPDPPEELPFRILLKGLLPHPLLRNRVKEDFEEMFPDQNIYDPPE